MIYQQRPFFRKKIKLHCLPYSTLRMFKNHNKAHRNVKNQKLTPHKFKRTNICIHIKNYVLNVTSFKFFKVIDIHLSPLNIPYLMSYRSVLGVLFESPYIKGITVNTFVTNSMFFKHLYLQIDSMNYKLIGNNLVTHFRSKRSDKIFGTNSYQIATFQNDGSIQLKLMSSIKIFTESTFILGLTTKFNTRNINLVSSVRGISKNPVDHPNGGRANTKGSFKTP